MLSKNEECIEVNVTVSYRQFLLKDAMPVSKSNLHPIKILKAVLECLNGVQITRETSFLYLLSVRYYFACRLGG